IAASDSSRSRSGRRMSCQNNLKNLAIAVLNYENARKKLPAAALSNALGNSPDAGETWSNSDNIDSAPSWIVQILPLIEESALATQFDLKVALTAINPVTA